MFGTGQIRATYWENATHDIILLVILFYFLKHSLMYPRLGLNLLHI